MGCIVTVAFIPPCCKVICDWPIGTFMMRKRPSAFVVDDCPVPVMLTRTPEAGALEALMTVPLITEPMGPDELPEGEEGEPHPARVRPTKTLNHEKLRIAFDFICPSRPL